MEYLAGGAWMHAAAPVEAEQWGVVARRAVGPAACELLGDQLADPRTVRVDVTEAQPAGLTGPQPESVAEGEDRPVGRAPLLGSWVVRQCGRGIEQATGRGDVEHERDTRGSGAASPRV